MKQFLLLIVIARSIRSFRAIISLRAYLIILRVASMKKCYFDWRDGVGRALLVFFLRGEVENISLIKFE